jgi:hypothetical protein
MSGRGRLVVMIGIALPVFYLFWILFVGTFSAHELEIGIIAALLATAGTAVIDVQYPSRFVPSVGELLSWWRLGWYLLSGTWEIMKVAVTDLLGTDPAESLLRISPFAAGDPDDERAVARRVLAITYTTVAPNFIILGINSSDQKMLFHQIKRSSVPKMTQRLGAQP